MIISAFGTQGLLSVNVTHDQQEVQIYTITLYTTWSNLIQYYILRKQSFSNDAANHPHHSSDVQFVVCQNKTEAHRLIAKNIENIS